MQLKYLKQIHKQIESDKSDFLNDVKNWIKGINDRLNQKRTDYGNYQVVRSGDP